MRPDTGGGTRTRREFITRNAPEAHVASVLVHAWPDSLASVASALARIPGVETHGSNDAGRLIVTIETATDAELLERIDRIGAVDRVITAALVYHEVDQAGEVDDDARG